MNDNLPRDPHKPTRSVDAILWLMIAGLIIGMSAFTAVMVVEMTPL